MEELKDLMELNKKYKETEEIRQSELADKKAELIRVQDELKMMDAPFVDCLKALDIAIENLRNGLLNTWNEEWGKQFTDAETNIMLTRKVRTTPEVHDEKALLTQAVTFDELPIKKISWDNSKLKALISAGIIKKNTASMIENYELAVTYPKE